MKKWQIGYINKRGFYEERIVKSRLKIFGWLLMGKILVVNPVKD